MSVNFPQTVNIEIRKSDSLSSSSQYITISEQSKRASSSKIKVDSYNLNYISSTNSYSFSYEIYYSNCKYLAFEILPDKKMSNVYVKATNNPKVFNYDLTSNNKEHLSKLYQSYIYKFYIPAKHDDKVEFEITGLLTSLNFDTIYIYEYSNRDSTSELSKTNIDTSSINSYSYTVTDSSCNYVALEIKPSSDLSAVIVKATVKSATSWVVVILIIIIIIGIIFLLVWYFIRRNKKKEISIENPSIQSLSPLQ